MYLIAFLGKLYKSYLGSLRKSQYTKRTDFCLYFIRETQTINSILFVTLP
jgi:hypothetical protein